MTSCQAYRRTRVPPASSLLPYHIHAKILPPGRKSRNLQWQNRNFSKEASKHSSNYCSNVYKLHYRYKARNAQNAHKTPPLRGAKFFQLPQFLIKITRRYDRISWNEERFGRRNRIFFIFFRRSWGSLVRGVNDRSKLVAGPTTEQPGVSQLFRSRGFWALLLFLAVFARLHLPFFRLSVCQSRTRQASRLSDVGSRANYFEKLFVPSFLESCSWPRI